jgi:hypothetical protein
VFSRSRKQLLVLLLLPLLALKALLPAGYMLSPEDGRLRVVMCSQGLAALTTPAHEGDDAPAGDMPVCGYAIAAVAAPPPVLASAWLPVRAAQLPEAVDSLPTAAISLRRYQSPRGPPALFLQA